MMCEILVRAVDNVHKDPVKDRQGSYKRHMPVVVMEDGHVWGKEEGPPGFYIVKVPGVPAKDMQKYCESEYLTGEILKEGDLPTLVRRREWHVDEMALVPGQISDINSKGELSLSTKTEADSIMSRVGG